MRIPRFQDESLHFTVHSFLFDLLRESQLNYCFCPFSLLIWSKYEIRNHAVVVLDSLPLSNAIVN